MNEKIKIEQMLKAANAYAFSAGLELSLEGEDVLIRKYAVNGGVRVTKVTFRDSFKFVSTNAYDLRDALKAWAREWLCTPMGIAEALAKAGVDPEDAPFLKIGEEIENQRDMLDVVNDYVSYLEGWLDLAEGIEFNSQDTVEGYVVEITETLQRRFFVIGVEDDAQARKLVSERYDRGNIVLDTDDLKRVDIESKTPFGIWYNAGYETISADEEPVRVLKAV